MGPARIPGEFYYGRRRRFNRFARRSQPFPAENREASLAACSARGPRWEGGKLPGVEEEPTGAGPGSGVEP